MTAKMKNWVFSAGVTILFDVKHPDMFQSIRWGRTSNPDLAFASMDTVMIHRWVLSRFLRSIIKPLSPVELIPSYPVKCWNFRKANWEHFTKLFEVVAHKLPHQSNRDINAAYATWCFILMDATKGTIPRGFRKCFVLTRDKTVSTIFDKFTKEYTGHKICEVAINLLQSLDEQKRRRCKEEIASINFTHSCRKVGGYSTALLAGLLPQNNVQWVKMLLCTNCLSTGDVRVWIRKQ